MRRRSLFPLMMLVLALALTIAGAPPVHASDPPADLPRPSLFNYQAADADMVAGEVGGTVVTLGEVNRRLDVDLALLGLRAEDVPELTDESNVEERLRRQRQMAERLVDERVVAARAAAEGVSLDAADVEAELAFLSADLQLAPDEIALALADLGADMGVLREMLRATLLVGRYAGERIVTGANPEHLDDYERWIAAARQSAGARVLLPAPASTAPRG